MNSPYPHQLELGGHVDGATLAMLLQSNRDSELVRGLMQALRNQAAMLERAGRQPPPERNPLEYRAYHAGAADAIEELLLAFYAMAHPTPGQTVTPPEGMESELDDAN